MRGAPFADAASAIERAAASGQFGWYGIFSTWFWAWPARRAVVLLFSHVLDPTMSFPLFSDVVDAVERALPLGAPLDRRLAL